MKKDFHIAIAKIKEIEFFIDESVEFTEGNLISITFSQNTSFNIKLNLFELSLDVRFFRNDTNVDLMRIKTVNGFNILELKELFDKNKNQCNLPEILLTTVLSLSISHTRAFLAKNTQGTKYADLFIPIINPTELVKQLFSQTASHSGK